MADTSAPSDGGWSTPTTSGTARRADDGWGPATNVRAGRRMHNATRADDRPADRPAARELPRGTRDRAPQRPAGDPAAEWRPAGPVSAREQRATRKAERAAEVSAASAREPLVRPMPVPERGLPWWAALLVLIAIAAIGGLIDTLGAFQVKGGFNIGIVVASVVAILTVKRSQMFPVVIAPPIVYSAAALFQLYVRSSGLHDKKVVFDAAANYLVYGFPAIAAATAAVLIIAGVRLIIRK
ncbi:MAG TPA: DUF6542 domain-containing protein [Jatrophihabitans sp.]|nr:DUF6542 domain-containing protein [Jatrophihabitans sp.]